LADRPHIPIFPCSGNRTAAVNPALVRAVETQAHGNGVKIIFDRDHELLINASLQSVMKALWDPSPVAEIQDLKITDLSVGSR
jgi:hypothetical protein